MSNNSRVKESEVELAAVSSFAMVYGRVLNPVLNTVD